MIILASTLQSKSSPGSSLHDLLFVIQSSKAGTSLRTCDHLMVKVPGSMHWHQVHFSSNQGYYYCHMASNAGMLFLTCLIVLIKVSFHTVKKISLQTGVLFEIVAPCLHTGTTFIHLLMRSQFRSFRLLKRWSVVSSLLDQIRPNY